MYHDKTGLPLQPNFAIDYRTGRSHGRITTAGKMAKMRLDRILGGLAGALAGLLLAAGPGQTADFTNFIGMEFATIPAGSFFMGSCRLIPVNADENRKRQFLGQAPLSGGVTTCPSAAAADSEASDAETPQHRVTIGQPFQLGVHPVTLGQFKRFLATHADLVTDAFMKNNAYGDNVPVTMVSWHDARVFIDWMNRNKPGSDPGRYRLPSEAEWEYAARAGTTSRYWWGNDVGRGNANCQGCGSRWDVKRPSPVGSFRPNRFGLYDMGGNVYQWVEDCWHDNYSGAPGNGGAWTSGNCSSRVLRGGSWIYNPSIVRSAYRSRYDVDSRYGDNGFRVVRTVF